MRPLPDLENWCRTGVTLATLAWRQGLRDTTLLPGRVFVGKGSRARCRAVVSQAFQQECVSEWELVRHRPEEAGDEKQPYPRLPSMQLSQVFVARHSARQLAFLSGP